MGNLGTINNGCGQTFYDSGGASGNYNSSENLSVTFCAPAGQYITFNFTSFGLGAGDALKIYNGNNTSAQLLGNYTTSPGQITSTQGGCLTFVFTSDAATPSPFPFLPPITTNGTGWAASITCSNTPPPPPPPTPGSCAAASPFCTSTGATYAAATGTTSQTGPNYGCLSTQPSPAWFYLNIATSGNIQINLSNSVNQDIDFAIWGPFNTQNELCNGITNAPIDCSYSTSPTEQVDIPNAVAGQWYIMIITNFADNPTNISALAGDAAGTDGTTNCAILCNMTALTATPGACNASTNQFTLNGQITVQYPPTSGTLTVTNTCGTSITIPTPWNSPISYSMPGLNANGSACSVTATFSADPTCSLTQTYTAPAACTNNPVCAISAVTAVPSACNAATNTYSLSGQISFSNAPSTGTLTVNGSCGGSQTFNAPFTSPLSYSFTNLNPTGGACSVTAAFSSNPSCTLTQSYASPTACNSTSCLIDTLTASIGSCQPNNSFTVSGLFRYENSPASGSVTVTVTNSSGTQTQTFNPPFVNGQNYNYSVTMNSDGSPLTVSVSFSADPGCSLSLNSTSPANCNCAAQIGTFSVSTDGAQNQNNVRLCFGDTFTITPNGNWIPPAEVTNPPASQGYDPDIIWLLYTCPPTVATVPNPNTFITDDPCLIAVINSPDVTDTNDLSLINNFPPGTFTANTVYLVPVTAYNVSVSPILVSYSNSGVRCYSMGQYYAVQYLPNVTFTQAQNCATGTVVATVSGGLPAVNGSQFTAVPGSLSPATATFVNSTASNNGTITVGGLQNGNVYSFDIQDGNGCKITVAGTFQGGTSSTLAYPKPAYCKDEPDPVPTLTGAPGGVYSSTNGLSINSSTGIINLAASTPGAYTITYTPTAGACQTPSTFSLTVNALPIINAGADVTICEGQSVILTASGANQLSWNNNVQNGVAFFPAVGITTYTVTGTSQAGCTNTDQVSVTVAPIPSAQFTPNITMGCIPLTVTFTNASIGSNQCTWTFGDNSQLTGCSGVTHTFTQEGCFDITLNVTSNQGCTQTLTIPDLICVEKAPVADFIPSSNIVTEFDNTINFYNTSTNAISYLWNFGVNSDTSSLENPSHQYPVAEQGTGWTIRLIARSPMGCADTAFATIYFQEELIFYVPNTFTPDNDDFNQTFQPIFTSGFDPYDFSMWIFNRWGEVIFETHDATKGWDGSYGNNGEVELVQDGTYSWKIEFKTNRNDERKRFYGHVNVLR